MKKLLFLVVLLSACNSYVEVIQTQSTDLYSTDQGYSYQNDSIRVQYAFWEQGGIMQVLIYNKLNVPIYIDWKTSSFIENGTRVNYWVDQQQISSTNVMYGRLYRNGTAIGVGNTNTTVYNPERVTSIPPNSQITVSHFYILPQGYVLNEGSFNNGSSPLRFRNYLVISTSESLTNLFYVDDSFFILTVNSIFEDTNVPLRTWFLAIYLCTSHKKGISSVQLAKDCGVTQKTAWHLEHRIREMLRAKEPLMLSNEVEIDETYIGGVEGNKHFNKRIKFKKTTAERRNDRGAPRLPSDKAVVLGLVERDGKVVAKQIPHARVEHILPLIDKHIEKGSTMLTDEYYAYGRVEKLGYTHKTVNHGLKVYVIGYIHTNTIENFWSVLKRGLYGIYHYTSKKHLDRYLDEFCARYNTRGLGEVERFNNFLTQCGDTTLTWKNLTQAQA